MCMRVDLCVDGIYVDHVATVAADDDNDDENDDDGDKKRDAAALVHEYIEFKSSYNGACVHIDYAYLRSR